MEHIAYSISFQFSTGGATKNVQVTLNMQCTEKVLMDSGISSFFSYMLFFQCNILFL